MRNILVARIPFVDLEIDRINVEVWDYLVLCRGMINKINRFAQTRTIIL
jgi:hypothetical protein